MILIILLVHIQIFRNSSDIKNALLSIELRNSNINELYESLGMKATKQNCFSKNGTWKTDFYAEFWFEHKFRKLWLWLPLKQSCIVPLIHNDSYDCYLTLHAFALRKSEVIFSPISFLNKEFNAFSDHRELKLYLDWVLEFYQLL